MAKLRPGWLRRQGLRVAIEVLAWPDSKLKQAGFSRKQVRINLRKKLREGSDLTRVILLQDRIEELCNQVEQVKKSLYDLLSAK